MTKPSPPDLRLPALQIRQGKSRVIYSFAVDGKRLPEFTSISRIARDDRRLIQGYQRPEVLSHIAQIRQYVESEAPLLPNSIVVAFDQRVRFVPDRRQAASPYSSTGTIVIPLNGHGDTPKPGWIVDGQQRVAAIREARVKCFPISVVGFIADSDDEQREQFILVNSTKPLPKGLLYELLPSTTARLPDLLQRRRFPARLLDLLNQQDDSPLRGLISTPTTPTGVIKDNSILKMLEHSLSDGVLFRFRDPDGDDVDSMFDILKNFWQAVHQTFKTAWGLPPNKSRLMHGAGVVSLGFLMDAIADRHRHLRIPPVDVFAADLLPLRDECRWTDGYWDFGPGAQPKWNEIQNTTRDIQVLSNHLLVRYKALVWNRPMVPTDSGRSGPTPRTAHRKTG